MQLFRRFWGRRFKPMGPFQSINDPDRPVYITLHKNFRAPQRFSKTHKDLPKPTKILQILKTLYNFEKDNIQYLI